MKELLRLLMQGRFRALFLEQTNNIWIQLLRYGFVGGLAFLVDFGTLALLHHGLDMNLYLATALAFCAGLCANYLLSKWAVFQQKAKQGKLVEFITYGVIGVIGLGLTELLIWLLSDRLDIAPLLAKGIAAVLVLLWNFLARRFVLYRPEKQ
ncbi:MAG: GtrA family protein [Ruminococcus sp.]|nr:GtrA family protein [Ruminococcus sp.]